jgi:hypothetical protein
MLLLYLLYLLYLLLYCTGAGGRDAYACCLLRMLLLYLLYLLYLLLAPTEIQYVALRMLQYADAC